eukprot:5601240-Pleurochrysis_carterae.AAC.1
MARFRKRRVTKRDVRSLSDENETLQYANIISGSNMHPVSRNLARFATTCENLCPSGEKVCRTGQRPSPRR